MTPQALPLPKPSRTDLMEAFLRQNPWRWIDGRRLATLGSSYAWRTELSRCRKRGLTIENRQRTVWDEAKGDHVVISEYQYVP